MMPGGGASSHPHAIEQARTDFKIYMSKLLEHSAVLDPFRPHTRQSDAAEAGTGSPAWGPPVGTSGGGGSVRSARGSPPAGAVLDVPEISFSPSYFREEQAWPRAGASTPPRPRPPPNFSWAAEKPPPPPPPRPTPSEEQHRTGVTVEDDSGDGWKVEWSRRFARGPIHSEYQDRFPWPPVSVLRTPTGAAAAAPALPLMHRRGRKPASAWGAGEAISGGIAVGDYGRSSAIPARSASPLPSRRREENSGGSVGVGSYGAARGRSAPPRDRTRAGAEGGDELRRRRRRRRPLPSEEGARGHSDGDHDDDSGERMTAAEGPVGRGNLQPAPADPVAAAAASSTPFGAGRQALEREDDDSRADTAGRSTVVLASSDGRVSEWEEAVGSSARGSDGNGAARFDNERRWAAGTREHDDGRYGGGDGGSSVVEVDMAGQGQAGGGKEAGPEGVEVWRGEATGRGGVTAMSGGRTLDYSSQSILTEYMDEYAWPARLPVPGRRGQRTGMGVDHVGRLLAGKRAEEPRRPPDPDVVARLGAAADRALKAGTPRHLSEMCRLKSPSPACRRLVLGLVVALGLRWRRWSDIRTHLLGNRPELQGFLSRFDKHRAGLTSAALRPFTEDPNLSPTEVRRVAACMVWVSRWLRALHDYLAVKEGKLDADAAPIFKERPAARSGGTAARRHRSSSRGRVHRTPLGSVRGRSTERASGGEAAGGADGARGRAGGVGAAVGGHGAQRPEQALSSAAPEGREDSRDDDHGHSSRRTRRTRRHTSEAAATRGGSSTGRPVSITTGSAVDFEAPAKGSVEDGGGGDLDYESQWTAGTVTSRGDVLEAPTEDQLDVGSSVVVVTGKDKENARTDRQKYHSSISGGGGGGSQSSAWGVAASSTRGGAAPSTAAATRAGTTVATYHVGGAKDARRSARRGLSWGPQASHSCIYRHEQKSRTPSHIANPKARRPTRARSDPILANTRWPPPVEVRARDRTEQRSAFSLEHSFLAYE